MKFGINQLWRSRLNVVRISLYKLIWRGGLLFAAGLVFGLALRALWTQGGPPLEPWHTYVPPELHASQIDAASWAGYLQAEDRTFDAVRTHVTQKLKRDERVVYNRYFSGSPMYPPRFKQNWNRSYLLRPAGPPQGAVVLLHGLTDSPYSLRHVARQYQQRGFVAVGIRLPAHGTTPSALTDVEWEDWLAAARLAVREAKQQIRPDQLLHLVGFSNGGALAMKYTLDALDDQALARPDRIVLISPMIGVSQFSRFAGVAGWPSVFPAFAKAAWINILPEYNPFKYNSFPVNAARQSYRLTSLLQEQLAAAAAEGKLKQMPPVLTFQSVLDSTVLTSAVITSLYGHLPDNGSELVLFDVNRSDKLDPLLQPSSTVMLSQLLPPAPRHYQLTVIANASPQRADVVERSIAAQSTAELVRELGLVYPTQIYSLSHIALPFPMDDPLYGLQPDLRENYGVRIGAFAIRGESQALIVSLDTLLRLSCNPFYPYMMQRIDQGIGKSA